MTDRTRAHRLLVVAVLAMLTLGACGTGDPHPRASMTDEERAATMSTNPFIPEDVNIGDCISSLPRPGCGNEIRGDSHSMLTAGVLLTGIGFIGWRIGRQVRRGDRKPDPDPIDRG